MGVPRSPIMPRSETRGSRGLFFAHWTKNTSASNQAKRRCMAVVCWKQHFATLAPVAGNRVDSTAGQYDPLSRRGGALSRAGDIRQVDSCRKPGGNNPALESWPQRKHSSVDCMLFGYSFNAGGAIPSSLCGGARQQGLWGKGQSYPHPALLADHYPSAQWKPWRLADG